MTTSNWRVPTSSSLALVLLFLSGCSSEPDPVKFFGSSEFVSLEIYIDQNSTLQIDRSGNPEEIARYASSFAKERTPEYKCGYDGRIVFTRKSVNYDVHYNLDPDCQHFAYIIDDVLYTRKITRDGVDLIMGKMEDAVNSN